jgi:hypothetical protein
MRQLDSCLCFDVVHVIVCPSEFAPIGYENFFSTLFGGSEHPGFEKSGFEGKN